MKRTLLVAGFLAGCASCAGARWPPVLDPADIVELSEGTPRIRRVRDLGTIHIGRPGPLRPESDGQLTVGELFLVEGSGFGKQPTLELGGRPAEVLWRTAGGGIIAQVPVGVAAGPRRLVLLAGGARAEAAVVVRRLAVLLDVRKGLLHTLVVDGGPGAAAQVGSVGQPLPVPGAKAVVVAGSGAAAYVVTAAPDRDRVAIVDLGAPGAPRVVDTRDLTHRASAAVAAERAPVVAFLGDQHVTLWDAREARRPAPYPAARLPQEALGARAGALDPSGTLLALALPEGNRVVLCDVRPGPRGVRPTFLSRAEALPGARQPLLADLRFSPDGVSLWALSGDLPEGRAAGHQPTRLTLLRVGAPEGEAEAGRTRRELVVERTVELVDAGAPVQLQLARALPPASGATVRAPPERAALFVTSVAPEALAGGAPSGALLRADSAGQTTTIYSGGELLGGVGLTPDGVVAVVGQSRPGREGLAALVAHTEMTSTVSLPLGAVEPQDLRPPFPATHVALQP